MNWKERFKPNNNAERNFFILLLFIGYFLFFVMFSDQLGRFVIIFHISILVGGIYSIARSVYHQIQDTYIVTKFKNTLISSVWATILLFTGVFIFGFSFVLIGLLLPFLPEWMITILWAGSLILLWIKSSAIINPIQKILLEHILKLPKVRQPLS